jgi:hypothetical protein
MHLVRVGVVCAMLDALRFEDGRHVFIVKGGTAMQLRLGIRARATTDLDMIVSGSLHAWLERFDEATVNRTWNGFTVARKGPPVQIDVPGVGYGAGVLGCRSGTRAATSGRPASRSPSTRRPVLIRELIDRIDRAH